MANITQARAALVARVLEAAGEASQALRRAAFEGATPGAPWTTLVERVIERAHRVTDDDVAAVKAAGQTEDQIFEIVVCAALGQATREHDLAVAALDAAEKD
jgi:hypothetical protein